MLFAKRQANWWIICLFSVNLIFFSLIPVKLFKNLFAKFYNYDSILILNSHRKMLLVSYIFCYYIILEYENITICKLSKLMHRNFKLFTKFTKFTKWISIEKGRKTKICIFSLWKNIMKTHYIFKRKNKKKNKQTQD